MPNKRKFIIGETVHLKVLVFQPGTTKPIDADSVSITSLKHDGTPMEFLDVLDNTAVGVYTTTIPTEDLLAGVYTMNITVDDGDSAVVILRDTFVLEAA